MASTNKTELLKLPQWQDNDKLEMTDLNDAFEKVDTGFTTHLAEDVTQGNPHGIDAKANKSWWGTIEIPLQNGWTGTLRCVTNDTGIKHLYTDSQIVAGTSTYGTVIGTIPVGYRPSATIVIPIYNNVSGEVHLAIVLDGTGALTLRVGSAVASGHVIRFNQLYR